MWGVKPGWSPRKPEGYTVIKSFNISWLKISEIYVYAEFRFAFWSRRWALRFH